MRPVDNKMLGRYIEWANRVSELVREEGPDAALRPIAEVPAEEKDAAMYALFLALDEQFQQMKQAERIHMQERLGDLDD